MLADDLTVSRSLPITDSSSSQVYRMSSDSIGCSLAEAAESNAYEQYLSDASKDGHPGLHVVYINTSLRTKALSHKAVPTITCTSSNVVNTVLQVLHSALICVIFKECTHSASGNITSS